MHAEEQLDGKPLIVVSCVSFLTAWRLHRCCTLSESINSRAKGFLRWPSFLERTYSLVFTQLYWNISSLKSEINTALISDRCIKNACVAGAAVTSLTSSHQVQLLQIGTDPEFSFMHQYSFFQHSVQDQQLTPKTKSLSDSPLPFCTYMSTFPLQK